MLKKSPVRRLTSFMLPVPLMLTALLFRGCPFEENKSTPTVSTTRITAVTSHSVMTGGNISGDGASLVLSRGVVWGTSPGPTVALSTKTTNGMGTGSFTSTIYGLAPATAYYVRAYATNAAGTGYGNEISFTTPPSPSSTPTPAPSSHDPNKVQVPVGGNAWADNGALITPEGLTNWVNPASVCRTYIRLSRPGTLKVSLKINATNGNNMIKVTLLNKPVQLPVSGNGETEVFAGQWEVPNEGYISIDVQGVSKTSSAYGILSQVYISGSSVTSGAAYVPNNNNNMFYWARRGASVHLWHDVSGLSDIEWFYSEIKVPANQDVVGSYYMANGFGEGYFGMQVNSPTERKVLFSVWSPYVTDNPENIPPGDRVLLVRKGANVTTGSFGNEGSGGQSYMRYNWKAETTYGFLLQGKPIDNNYTQYTAWFFAPEESTWYLIASWKRPKTSTYLKGIYSFLENFNDEKGNVTRMAIYGNQWAKERGGYWKEITSARHTASNEHVYRKDYAGGTANGGYYLKNGGFFDRYTPLDQTYYRQPANRPPNVDLNTLP